MIMEAGLSQLLLKRKSKAFLKARAEKVSWLNTHRLLDKLLFHCIKRVGNQEIMLQIF
jgi:hypothetical protein